MLGKIVLTSFLVALPAVALADVRVDLDRSKDFGKYRTFTVELGPLVRPDGTIDEHNTLAENRLRDAVTRELESRGLESTDSSTANLVVRVSGRDTDRVSIVSTGFARHTLVSGTGVGDTGDAPTGLAIGERPTTTTS